MNIKSTPIPVLRALRKLGQDLKDVRRRRRLPMKLAAERAGLSRTTLNKIEKGEGGVALALYAKILFVYGIHERLSMLADVTIDTVGLDLETEHLPKRIRVVRKIR